MTDSSAAPEPRTDEVDHGPDHRLEQVRRMGAGSLLERMGIEFLEAGPERLVATMPVEGNTQPMGLLHGGASCVLAESLGSVGATLHGAARGMVAVGVDINATHHRSTSTGLVTGTATALHLGGSVASYAIEVKDEGGRLLCTARITCLLRRPPQ